MGDPMEKLRAAALKRGVHGIKSFGRMFRLYDDDKSRTLSFEEFRYGCQDYGVDMSMEELQACFKAMDMDNSGNIIFDEFLQRLRPPMSKARQTLITAAFNKLDKTGDGVITVEDIKNKYDVNHHPKFKSGEYTKKKVLEEFLISFQMAPGSVVDDKVTREEFLNYYAGVSASIDKDVYFDFMMRQAWKL